MNLSVKMQESRQRSLNRFLALRELVDQIEIILSPGTSKRLKEMERIKKQKDRRRRRAKSQPPQDPGAIANDPGN